MREERYTLKINPDLLKSLNRPEARLSLSCQGKDCKVAPGPRVFKVGRDEDCNIIIDGESISRVHASFVYRRGKFILIDHSTNGTFLRLNGSEELCLVEDEQCPLTGSGIISLGRSTVGANPETDEDVIRFTCIYSPESNA